MDVQGTKAIRNSDAFEEGVETGDGGMFRPDGASRASARGSSSKEGMGMLRGTPKSWILLAATFVAGCSGETGTLQSASVESCMQCHNGTLEGDYSGPGIENPHPFAGADQIRCTTCHGGNPNGTDALTSHVPPPPQIGDDAFRTTNAKAYFNRLTLQQAAAWLPMMAPSKSTSRSVPQATAAPATSRTATRTASRAA